MIDLERCKKALQMLYPNGQYISNKFMKDFKHLDLVSQWLNAELEWFRFITQFMFAAPKFKVQGLVINRRLRLNISIPLSHIRQTIPSDKKNVLHSKQS